MHTRKKITWSFQSPTIKPFHQSNTICRESRCPNIAECSAENHAAFLIGGSVCTRNCQFCNVQTGKPRPIIAFQKEETEKILKAIDMARLQYVVITSVTRDDDPKSLAAYFNHIGNLLAKKKLMFEFLIPDFNLNQQYLDLAVQSDPEVLAHNIETVERITPLIRNRASYKKSMDLLQYYKQKHPKIITKSGFMTGLGETLFEIEQTIRDLKGLVDILTIGQYLAPAPTSAPVKKEYTTEEFNAIQEIAENNNIPVIFSGPFVRSSYKAYEARNRAQQTRNNTI